MDEAPVLVSTVFIANANTLVSPAKLYCLPHLSPQCQVKGEVRTHAGAFPTTIKIDNPQALAPSCNLWVDEMGLRCSTLKSLGLHTLIIGYF